MKSKTANQKPTAMKTLKIPPFILYTLAFSLAFALAWSFPHHGKALLAVIPLTAFARSTGYVAFNGANFFSCEKIDCRILPGWEPVMTSMHGPIDAVKKDLAPKLTLRLWGAYENLSTLFPSYLMNPSPGTAVFGGAPGSLVVQATNNDTLTYLAAAVIGMPNLYLGVDSPLFAADVEFSFVIGRDGSGNLLTPETASSYTTRGTASFSAATAAFAKTNFVRTRFVNAWESKTGFTTFAAQKGVNIKWEPQLAPVPCDGYGTIDYTVKGMVAQASMIPLGPTQAQMKTNSQEEAAMGTLASAISGDLICTGNNSGPVITLKNAYIKQNGLVYDAEELRIGEATWETTRSISSGTPSAVATAA